MYELKKIGKVLTSKYVGTGPSSYEKRIYRAAVTQRLRNADVDCLRRRTAVVHFTGNQSDIYSKDIHLERYPVNRLFSLRSFVLYLSCFE